MSGSKAGALDRPIVILGAPRSGTTFLARLLELHPDTARTREARLTWRYGNDRRSDELHPADARPEVVDHIRAQFAGRVGELGGGRLVEKTPANSVRPWFVDAVFPDARFVHVTRNGWSCVPGIRDFWSQRGTGLDAKQRSKARRRLAELHPRQAPFYAKELLRRVTGGRHTALYGPRITGLQDIVDEHGVLEAAGHQWRACVERAALFGRDLGPERYLELKLETLDPAAIAELLRFCDLRHDDALVAQFAELFDPARASRRPTLTDDEVRRLTVLIEPTNAFLGLTGPASRC